MPDDNARTQGMAEPGDSIEYERPDMRPPQEDAVPLQTRLARHWSKLSVATQFMIAAALVVMALMLLLGYWANERLERVILRNAGKLGGAYVQNFLQPHVQDLLPDGTLPPEAHRALDELLNSVHIAEHVVTVKIWNRDGTIIYSDEKHLIGQPFALPELDRLLRGEIVTHYEDGDHDDGDEHAHTEMPLIEIYAPLRDAQTGEVVAVGEFYELATHLQDGIRRLGLETWATVAVVTIPMVGLLYLIVRRANNIIASQGLQLRIRLSEARQLARQNARLKRTADKARIEASRSNETLLGRIGSDLHDGPVQLLSLLILKLGARSSTMSAESIRRTDLRESDREIAALADQVMGELRTVSTGLSLPELEHLSLTEVLKLAARRHENLTGTQVEEEFAALPDEASHPLKICLYRIVQEALQNAARHAGGVGQKVAARLGGPDIVVEIADEGPGLAEARPEAAGQTKAGPRLGLTGMRNRVKAFGGRLEVSSKGAGGTRVTVSIPLQ